MTADIIAGLVKPLVWEHHPMGFIAAPPTGRAYIIDIRVKGRVMFIKGIDPPPQVDSVGPAQAAAEADYRSRIAAALDVEKIAALVEAVAKIETRGDQMIWGEDHEVRAAFDDMTAIARAALAAFQEQKP